MNTTLNQVPLSLWKLRFLTFIAVGLVIMGLICNIIFYSEFGEGFSSFAYAIIGILLDLAKIAVIGLFVIFVIDFEENLLEVTLCGGVWILLSILSLGAAYGFLSQINEKYEATRLKQSRVFAQHEAAVKMAQTKVEQHSKFASIDVVVLERKKNQLTANLLKIGLQSA